MAEVKNKVVTVESLKAKHDYDESTYLKKSGALGTLGITATAAELNKMDGVTATTAELNYVDGVTSNIQTQLNGKASSNHKHYAANVAIAGEDLNNYTDAGLYSFSASYTPTNAPSGNSNGWLLVMPWKQGNVTVKQVWFRHGSLNSNDFKTYVRTQIGSSGWSDWSEYYTTNGGTITGNVEVDGTTTLNNLLVFTTDKGIQAKHPTNNNLYHQFQPINSLGNCTIGYGMYNAGIGSTDIFGQKIDLKSKSDINLTGNLNVTSSQAGLTDSPYGVNQLLWSGASYMQADTTAPLSKKISTMPHGIVLIFSSYKVGEGVQNSHWHYFFVPKYAIGIDGNGGSSFTLMKGGKMYMKYIYINDSELVGSDDNNNSSFSLHGQTVDNRNFVLRYVVGV